MIWFRWAPRKVTDWDHYHGYVCTWLSDVFRENTITNGRKVSNKSSIFRAMKICNALTETEHATHDDLINFCKALSKDMTDLADKLEATRRK